MSPLQSPYGICFWMGLGAFVTVFYALIGCTSSRLFAGLTTVVWDHTPAFSVHTRLVFLTSVAAGATIVKIEIQVSASAAAVRVPRWTDYGGGTAPSALRRSAGATILCQCDDSAGLLESTSPIIVGACIQGSRGPKPW